jgi:hypothetical protein
MKSLAKKLILPILALLGAALPVSAALLGLEFGDLPSANWFNTDIGSMVARLADGSYAVVWSDPTGEARLQWVRPDGSEVLQPGGRPFATRAYLEFPLVVAHPTAGAFVAFPVSTDRGSRILVQSFDGAASPRWAGDGVLALDSPGIENQSFPQILASADGGVFVCFIRSASPGATDRDQTVCQRLGPDGQPLWSGGRVAEGRLGERFALGLAPDGQGGVLVFATVLRVLASGGGPLPLYSVEGQRLSPDGTRLWDPRGKIFHETISYDYYTKSFAAVSDGHGGAILAFGDRKGTRQSFPAADVVAQRVDNRGTPLWGEGVRVASGFRQQTLDSLTALPDGGAAVVVQEILTNSQAHLILYRLGPGGQLLRPVLGTPLSVPNRAQFDYRSQGSFDGDRLRILWTSHALGDNLHLEVRIAVFDRYGHRLTPPDAPPLAAWGPGEGRVFEGFAFDAARDQGLAVWDTLRSASPQSLDIRLEGALFGGEEGVP